jgi:hypothetical protein
MMIIVVRHLTWSCQKPEKFNLSGARSLISHAPCLALFLSAQLHQGVVGVCRHFGTLCTVLLCCCLFCCSVPVEMDPFAMLKQRS